MLTPDQIARARTYLESHADEVRALVEKAGSSRAAYPPVRKDPENWSAQNWAWFMSESNKGIKHK